MSKAIILKIYTIILIEGFFTLSIELLVMRQITPFVGNGTEMISIVISSVLLPLAIGYYRGGIKYLNLLHFDKRTKLRKILTENIFIITLLTGTGFSYYFLAVYFNMMKNQNLMLSLSIYLTIFLAIPAYLLGQTVPLVSNYFPTGKVPKIAGQVLFLSTAGSFLGSTITVLILMKYFGVSNTLILNTVILSTLLYITLKNKLQAACLQLSIVSLICLFNIYLKKPFHIIYENTYNTVIVRPFKNDNILTINNSASSLTNSSNTKFFEYVNAINEIVSNSENKEVLVIGAGGFTVGFNDIKNKYTYIDIDIDLKTASENLFLKTNIKENKIFIQTEARKFLKQNAKKYDIVIVDAFTNLYSPPVSLTSVDFYLEISSRLKSDGYIIFNQLIDPLLRDTYSLNIDATLRAAFKSVVTIPILEENNLKLTLKQNPFQYANVLYVVSPVHKESHVYTDDLNTISFDANK